MAEFDETDRSPRTVARSLVVYARLVRLPNLFTAPPDVVLGAAVVAGLGFVVSVESVAGLAVASVLLYAAGTTLNDYFDAAEDARERPERPIPAGEISRTRAVATGLLLLGCGIVAAAAAGGMLSATVAAVLALLVVLYDGVVKGSALGFLVMGGTRGTNVLLGISAAGTVQSLPAWAVVIPVVVLLYVAGVTYMAEHETGESERRAVSIAVVGAAVAVVGAAAVLAVRSPPAIDAVVAGAFVVAFVGWTGSALRAAYTDPAPATIGPAVGKCVLGLILLDAAFAATTGTAWAIATAAFLVPAVGLARVFDVS